MYVDWVRYKKLKKGEVSGLPLSQILFKLECDLCKIFPSLNVFDIRKEKATEVFLLMRRINNTFEAKIKTKRKRVYADTATDGWY